ncbi:hypothetical protein CYMTET_23777 [Cymbomonas tetramitiformis]|uniref:Uncharacterized protein n=1 Tax=Cymbomonas tetramitiformis TaxID=36881 RepID=A0AAE0L0K2_9CHLO|nr:hypothetical protein CYMTET_23777 [Cymbomonas tetramitiformis]
MFEAIKRDFPELWAWIDLCYGVEANLGFRLGGGADGSVMRAEMLKKVEDVCAILPALNKLGLAQAQGLLLRFCARPRLWFWLRGVPPETMQEATKEHDRRMREALQDLLPGVRQNTGWSFDTFFTYSSPFSVWWGSAPTVEESGTPQGHTCRHAGEERGLAEETGTLSSITSCRECYLREENAGEGEQVDIDGDEDEDGGEEAAQGGAVGWKQKWIQLPSFAPAWGVTGLNIRRVGICTAC